MKDRRILGEEGFLSVIVVVDSVTGKVVSGPEIHARGFAEDESTFDEIRAADHRRARRGRRRRRHRHLPAAADHPPRRRSLGQPCTPPTSDDHSGRDRGLSGPSIARSVGGPAVGRRTGVGRRPCRTARGRLSRLGRADATRQLLHRHGRGDPRGDRRRRRRRARLRRRRDRPTRGRHPRDDQRGRPAEVVAQILHRRTPAEQILDEFRKADKWGILRFVPAGRMSDGAAARRVDPRLRARRRPGAWHPEHALYAPLYSADGELLGNMAVDLPPDRRMPDEADRELLEMFAVQAGVALSNARERERLTERVRLDRMLKARWPPPAPSRACPRRSARPSWPSPSAWPGPGRGCACFPNDASAAPSTGRHAPYRCCTDRGRRARAPRRPDPPEDCLAAADRARRRRPVVTGSCPRSREPGSRS